MSNANLPPEPTEERIEASIEKVAEYITNPQAPADIRSAFGYLVWALGWWHGKARARQELLAMNVYDLLSKLHDGGKN